jgi:hypothetical protein
MAADAGAVARSFGSRLAGRFPRPAAASGDRQGQRQVSHDLLQVESVKLGRAAAGKLTATCEIAESEWEQQGRSADFCAIDASQSTAVIAQWNWAPTGRHGASGCKARRKPISRRSAVTAV